MKKKQALIIALALVVLVAVLIISQYYPPVDNSDSSGTIGKVDKYRDSKTKQEDIVLRNEFLKDTTALKSTIMVIDKYQVFLLGLNQSFKEWESELIKTKIEKNEKLYQQYKGLKSLTSFMDNNLSTVSEMRNLLYKYYTKDTLNMSIDVQNNLINFSTFLANLEEKGKVIDSLFISLTGLIENNKLALLVDTKEKTKSIIEVREKMLGAITAWGLAVCNEQRLNMALNSNILNIIILNRQLNNTLGPIFIVESKEKIGAILNFDHLAVLNKEKFGMGKSDQLNYVFSKSSLGLKAADVQMQNKNDLGSIVYTASVAAAINNKKLGTILNKEGLGIIYANNQYAFSKQNIGAIASQTSSLQNIGLGPIQVFAQAVQSFSELKNKENLGSF